MIGDAKGLVSYLQLFEWCDRTAATGITRSSADSTHYDEDAAVIAQIKEVPVEKFTKNVYDFCKAPYMNPGQGI